MVLQKAYDIDKSKISILRYDVVNSIKITFPRKNISGSLEDNDIYGAQQHMPLANILIGDMSLVGPRPPTPDEVEKYTLDDRKRLNVIPGLTGLWQISGRSDIPADKQLELDKKYIASQSFWFCRSFSASAYQRSVELWK